ncbi:hypothetical protein NB311A_09211 [Nitrobacter sp. Nb-311A]|uniref:hypothetical protein n=2 Tax=Nitrobacter TaxID=911 RepID=UPI0000685383|nr:hypothetical protein [Nitrobacter sp. Nb-311A]EAQ33577.1 hypothetical protein NB311A_09211 [Nitrobacter sp. Nb-311A]
MGNIAVALRAKGFKGANDPQEVVNRFIEYARSIMFGHNLVRGNCEWRITALELYLYFKDFNFWRDPYTHQRPAQLKTGTWYVHGDGCRAPTYSGIDITCGSEDHGVFGGLLIRELDKEQRWVFQRIVRGNRHPFARKGNKWQDNERKMIQDIHTKRIDDPTGLLQLVPCSHHAEALFKGPRIGLRPKLNEPTAQDFRLKPLRIAIWQTNQHKLAMEAISDT